MLVIAEIQGKQYKFDENDELEVDRIVSTDKKNTTNKVLLVWDGKSLKVGDPYIKGAKLDFEIKEERKLPKTTTIKHKAKKRYRRTLSSRAYKTLIKILKITT